VNGEVTAVAEALEEHPVGCEYSCLPRLVDRDHGRLKISDLAAALQGSKSTLAIDLPGSFRKIGVFLSVLVALARPRRFASLDVDDNSGFRALFDLVRNAQGDCQCIRIGPCTEFCQMLSPEASGSPVPDEDLQRRNAGVSRDLCMNVSDAVFNLEEGSLDLLYIGSLHTARALRRDFDVWLSKMSTEGIILFRDIEEFASEFGTWRLWHKLKQRYRCIEIASEVRIGVLVVGNESPLARYVVDCSPLSILSEMNDLFGHAPLHILSENEDLRAQVQGLGKKVSEFQDLSERFNKMMSENADLRADIGRLDHRVGELKLYVDKYDQSIYGRVRTAIRRIRRNIKGA
jgi:hypothetical protein